MTGESAVFTLFAAAAVAGAVWVLLARDVARMAGGLILALGAVGGLFFVLDAPFVGAAQLLVYVGGTVVLLIFGVMLTAGGRVDQTVAEAAAVRERVGWGELVFAWLTGAALLGSLLWATWDFEPVPLAPPAVAAVPAATPPTVLPIGLKFLGFRGAVGEGYLLAFEIVSVHLLVVLVGAAYIARAKRRAGRPGGGLR